MSSSARARSPSAQAMPKGSPPRRHRRWRRRCGLLSLPREVGQHPEDGQPILAGIGRFGPYRAARQAYANLGEDDEVFEDRPQPGRRPARAEESGAGALRPRGDEPGASSGRASRRGGPVRVHAGRYGPYVKHGSSTPRCPKGPRRDGDAGAGAGADRRARAKAAGRKKPAAQAKAGRRPRRDRPRRRRPRSQAAEEARRPSEEAVGAKAVGRVAKRARRRSKRRRPNVPPHRRGRSGPRRNDAAHVSASDAIRLGRDDGDATCDCQASAIARSRTIACTPDRTDLPKLRQPAATPPLTRRTSSSSSASSRTQGRQARDRARLRPEGRRAHRAQARCCKDLEDEGVARRRAASGFSAAGALPRGRRGRHHRARPRRRAHRRAGGVGRGGAAPPPIHVAPAAQAQAGAGRRRSATACCCASSSRRRRRRRRLSTGRVVKVLDRPRPTGARRLPRRAGGGGRLAPVDKKALGREIPIAAGDENGRAGRRPRRGRRVQAGGRFGLHVGKVSRSSAR